MAKLFCDNCGWEYDVLDETEVCPYCSTEEKDTYWNNTGGIMLDKLKWDDVYNYG